MQWPEAWPHPHPGERVGASQAGCPTPPTGLQKPSLYTIKAVFILDNDEPQLLATYYDDTFPSMKKQMVFEKNVFNKTSRTESEITFFPGSIDLFLYVVGSSHENENVEKRWLLENMDGAFLVLGEIVDGGVILQVIQKVNFRADDSSLNEQSVIQVLQSAKEQIKWLLLK
ncbi:COPZ2-like [Ictidomys tridecemlineatus]|uniref:Coatomer subunit zeta n=1 Tax=Ictidomys tridecemlineatus TaxID=43179 RepID=A0A287DGI1_ICTTR|nr:COPZ2-like [Ictidomys tridecemlineatus]